MITVLWIVGIYLFIGVVLALWLTDWRTVFEWPLTLFLIYLANFRD